MKCSNCQATLLPVEGELFCLQCGRIFVTDLKHEPDQPVLEDTQDPVLQEAIRDVLGPSVDFRLPVAAAPPRARLANMAPVREFVRPPRSQLLAMAGAGAAPVSAGVVVPELVPRLSAAETGPSQRAPAQPRRVYLRWNHWWLLAAVILVVLAAVNVMIFQRLQGQAYPGVRLAGRTVTGLTEHQVQAYAAGLNAWQLPVSVNNRQFSLPVKDFADYDAADIARQAMRVGRQTPVPLIGLFQAWFSQPLALEYHIDQAKLAVAVRGLASKVDHASHNASPVIIGNQVFVLADLAGAKLDEAAVAASVRTALANHNSVNANVQTVNPLVTAASLESAQQQAQQIMNTTLTVVVKTQSYTVPAATVAGWLRFDSSGNVALDLGAVTSYVAGLPGKFDRAGLVNDLIAKVPQSQAQRFTAGTSVTTAPSATVAARPVIAYNYCLEAASAPETQALAAAVQQTLGAAAGWSLGGQVTFTQQDSDCNFIISLKDTAGMKALAAACAAQTTCWTPPVLALAQASWVKPSATWLGNLAQYRSELINHEVGHVLGFDHTGCLATSVQPTLSTQSFNLGTGCSPVWYTTVRDSQNQAAILAGFAG